MVIGCEVLGILGVARRESFLDTDVTPMDFNLSDIMFLVVVLLLAITILNNGDGGGGRRARVPCPCAM